MRVVYQDGTRVHYPAGFAFTIRADVPVVKVEGTAVPMQQGAPAPLEQKARQ